MSVVTLAFYLLRLASWYVFYFFCFVKPILTYLQSPTNYVQTCRALSAVFSCSSHMPIPPPKGIVCTSCGIVKSIIVLNTGAYVTWLALLKILGSRPSFNRLHELLVQPLFHDIHSLSARLARCSHSVRGVFLSLCEPYGHCVLRVQAVTTKGGQILNGAISGNDTASSRANGKG